VTTDFSRAEEGHHGRRNDAVEDAAVLARIRGGDTRALDELFRLYAQPLGRFATRLTGSADLAQEVVQDVFVRLWETRDRLSLRGTVKSYLFQAARNQGLNILRHEAGHARRARDAVDAAGVGAPSVRNAAVDALTQDDLRAAVHTALSAVPPRCREIFLLNWESGLTYGEIADVLDIGAPTIHNQMSRATKQLVAYFRGPDGVRGGWHDGD
jgi:RNA polymerase sigma-70 factor (ECF subfamily)